MDTRRFAIVGFVLCLALAVPGCGGGGGGGGPAPTAVEITDITVSSQTPGPLSPFGTTQGGDTMELTGTGFALGLEVFVGGKEATVTSVGTNSVTLITPSGPEGFATVRVRLANGGTGSVAGMFQYVAPPVILSLKAITGPTSDEPRAPIDGGETIEVNGTNFKPGVRAIVDGTSVLVTFVDAGTIRFVAPARNNEISADVVVTNPEGLFSQSNGGLVVHPGVLAVARRRAR